MENTQPKRVPNDLRRCRRRRGLTQKEVAKILGIKSTSMLSRWESGACLPDTLNVFRAAVVYRTSADGLFMDFIHELRRDLIRKEEEMLKPDERRK